MYYDGTKLLSMTDINGNKPEIYMCTSNRSAGKTTWFNRYAVKKYRNENKKFMLETKKDLGFIVQTHSWLMIYFNTLYIINYVRFI